LYKSHCQHVQFASLAAAAVPEETHKQGYTNMDVCKDTLPCVMSQCSVDQFRVFKHPACSALPAAQSVEIVLTAHPTQVNRRTLQYKHSKIAALLQQHDRCAQKWQQLQQPQPQPKQQQQVLPGVAVSCSQLLM
jgi:phosphoenolpyruvate carboxylase